MVKVHRITWTRLIWSVLLLIPVMNKVVTIASGMHTISRFPCGTKERYTHMPWFPSCLANNGCKLRLTVHNVHHILLLRATSHTRLRARDHLCFMHSRWWTRSPSSLHTTTLEGPTEYICECNMDVKVYMEFYMASMDHVSWSLGLFSKNHFLEVGLTQNWETMALRTLATC